MNIHVISESIDWLEHKSKPLFVIVALLLYVISLVQLTAEVSPITQLDEYLIGALANLSIPFGIILLQELLELVANIAESNLLSARRQFEIVLLVIVRSFFKKFDKVSGYVESGEFSDTVQESVIKIGAIIILMTLIFAFRYMAESQYLRRYLESQGKTTNAYKQILVVILISFILGYLLFVTRSFEEIAFIRLVFTGVIIIDAVFLLIAIMGDSSFASITFESSLIIALIFARFPLFVSNQLSYILSVIGVIFATTSLFLMYKVANIYHERIEAMTGSETLP
ncbi:MAG: hypothetical protein ACI9EW_003062 [Cellvibrionaceae bacterium]|jgi:hypothetical protein